MSDIEEKAKVGDSNSESLRSIAISLKRIADLLETAVDVLADNSDDEDFDEAFEQMANQS